MRGKQKEVFVGSWLNFIYMINTNMLNSMLTKSSDNISIGRAFVVNGLTAKV